MAGAARGAIWMDPTLDPQKSRHRITGVAAMDLLSPRARTLDLRSALASDVSSSWPSTSSEIPLTDDVTVLLLDDNGLEHLLTPKLPPLDTLSLSSNKLTSLEPDVATLLNIQLHKRLCERLPLF